MEKIIKYSPFTTDDYLISNIIELWNHEVGFIFPISSKTFRQKTIECKYIDFKSSFVALDGEKVVGFIICKKYDNNPIMSKYINKGWVNIFYVSNKYRKQGIGSNLLKLAEEEMARNGINELHIGSDYNNFFPGIPSEFDNLTTSFLEKRNYNVGRYTHDLIKKIKFEDNAVKKDIKMSFATAKDKEKVLIFFNKNFPGRWEYEAIEYFEQNEFSNEYLLAFNEKEEVVGFLRVNWGNITNISYNIVWKDRFEKLAGIGPLGVDKDYRGKGIFKNMMNFTLNECYKNGCSEALIDWTGLMHIYQKFGFEVWKCYSYCFKKI